MKKDTKREKLIYFLKDKDSYPHKPKSVKQIQTHSADVFIVTPYVYKIKKPVNLGFLDFSTLNKRKKICEKEIELNKRLTKDIYLSVEKISENNGNFVFGEGEEVIEYAVKMRRLPEKYFLKNLLLKGDVNTNDFQEIIKKLVNFYNNQTVSDKISKFGEPEKISANIYENFDTARDFQGKTISKPCFEAVYHYNDKFFSKKKSLFKKRIKEGFIKDCHGDLRLEHINYSPKGINIFDCIEFNDRFRYIDIASEIGFLSMDLDFNGYKDFGRYVNSIAAKKLNDSTFFDIVDFYKCYRAYVRGKVSSLKFETEGITEKDRNNAFYNARKYFQLALKYALFGSNPFVLVVFGFIATGKSTISEMLSNELSATVLSSDKTRKEITGKKQNQRDFRGFGEGIYRAETTEKTYNEIIKRGMNEIKEGRNIILDASFSKRRYRQKVIEKFKNRDLPVFFVETTASEKIIKQRLSKRESKETISDARLDIFDSFKQSYESPDELDKNVYFRIKTYKNPERVISDLFCRIINAQIE